jgi:DNA-binding NarL/FixJ family response regulator
MRYEDARRAADPVTRLKAHALAVAVAVVRAPFAAFFAVTRRLEVDDVVILEPKAGEGVARAWAGSVARLEPLDPFAPRRVADSGASVVTLGDVDSDLDRYRGHLRDAGVEDVACLYLRSAGALVAGIGLLRERDGPGFAGHEVGMLRRLHPLLEHAYVFALRPEPGAPREPPVVAGLTPREAEVAHLVAIGASNAEIAHALSVSLATVKTHLTQIYAKLGLRSRTQLAVLLGADRS